MKQGNREAGIGVQFLDWNQLFWVWGGCGVSGSFLPFQYDSYEISLVNTLVAISVANNRLFVESIPKNKTKENILEEFSKVTGKTKMYLEISFWEICGIL